MPICVHLTTEKNAKQILRTGIKAVPFRDQKGIFCMPIMPGYYASHQWLRELKRFRGQPNLVAIDFKLPAKEMVLVGHFSQPHARMTVSQAAKLIMSAPDPLGYEIFLERSVKREEIHKVRAVSQVIGWRFSPRAKGRILCECCICRGEYGSAKLRQRLRAAEPPRRSREEVMTALMEEKNPSAIQELLVYDLPTSIRRNPEELEFLLEHPAPEVARGLAYRLRYYRGKKAIAMLRQLAEHADDEVRKAANVSLERVVPRRKITNQD